MMLRLFSYEARPHFHDARKGHHYYTTPHARSSCIVVMPLAGIMLLTYLNHYTFYDF